MAALLPGDERPEQVPDQDEAEVRRLGPAPHASAPSRKLGDRSGGFTAEDALGGSDAGVIEDPDFLLRPAEPPPEASEWFSDPEVTVAGFDEPEPGELVTTEAFEDAAGDEEPAATSEAEGPDGRRRIEDDEDIDSELVVKLIDGLNSL